LKDLRVAIEQPNGTIRLVTRSQFHRMKQSAPPTGFANRGFENLTFASVPAVARIA